MLDVHDAGQILGPIPSWLHLGPAENHDGVVARKVLGDWSHLQPWNRPPAYFLDEVSASHTVHPYDRTESREPVKSPFPGKAISELKGIHSGKVAILFNGPSLANHDLYKIKCPIIGMNRTHEGYAGYSGPQPDYLCIVDWAWFDRPEWWETVKKHPRIINGSTHSTKKCPNGHKEDMDLGHRVPRHSRMAPFSFDLERDGFVAPVPCTTGHLALQVAAYMGFTEIYCLGLDMGGPHFDGTPTTAWVRDANRYHLRQAPLLKEKGINVYLCGSPESNCTAFEHRPFEEIC